MGQLANDKPEFRFAGNNGKSHFVAELRAVTKKLSKKYKVIFSPHVHDDVELSRQVAHGIENAVVWDFSTYAFDRAIDSVGYYQNAKFVIAMRGHGQIVPIAFNTPVISLENHPKHAGLMRKLNISKYNISLAERNFGYALAEKIEQLEMNEQEYRMQLAKMNTLLSDQTMQGFRQIKDALNI